MFYRFKSQREPSRISFDGLSIGVWDLKKEIIHDAKMGKGADFDFAIYNQDTEEGKQIDHYSRCTAVAPSPALRDRPIRRSAVLTR